MDIYYSNAQSEKWDDIGIDPFPMLMAYYDYRKTKITRQKATSKVLLDSGAFSAYKRKIIIDVKDYIAFIKYNKKQVDHVVALDVFNQDQESYTNYMIMRDAGIDCIPVFHIDANQKYLKLYTKETSYIGIGGVALLSTANRRPFIDKIFREYPDPTQIGFHGFGIGDEALLMQYPWKSVDFRSVHLGARFGFIYTPWGFIRMNPNMPKNGPKEILWHTNKLKIEKIYEYLQSIGVDVHLAQEQNNRGKVERCKASIIYFEKYIKPKCPTTYKSKLNYLL